MSPSELEPVVVAWASRHQQKRAGMSPSAPPFDTTVVLLSLGFFEVNDAKHGDFRVSLAE
jgi:hypothetical protein